MNSKHNSLLAHCRHFLAAALALCLRFGMLPPNVSLLGSYGFMGGNFFWFFASIIAFDVLKGGFYPSYWVTYIGFAVYWLLGRVAKTTKQQLLLLPLASLAFYLVSNFGVFWYWYPRTLAGLLQCYLVAVPFYRNTLLGDVVFGYAMLLITVFAKKRAMISSRIATVSS